MHVIKIRKITGVILTLTAMICALVYPSWSIRTSAAENYRLWRQSDERWSDIPLGNSSATVRTHGCLVTSIAILAVHSGSENADEFNPGVFVKELNKIDGFSNGAISSWSKINEVIPDVAFVDKYTFTSSSQKGKAAEMKKIADEGKYMVCNVGYHWVFIDSIVGSKVYMIDPAKDDILLFEAYDLANITELRIFTGKNSPVNTTAATTAEPTTEIPYETGEYYNTGKSSINLCASPMDNNDVCYKLENGQIINVDYVKNGWGRVTVDSETCWVDMSLLTFAGYDEYHISGDINNDCIIDKTDLAILNEYIYSMTVLPEGISILKNGETSAADFNGDGLVDNDDALKYLELVCE